MTCAAAPPAAAAMEKLMKNGETAAAIKKPSRLRARVGNAFDARVAATRCRPRIQEDIRT